MTDDQNARAVRPLLLRRNRAAQLRIDTQHWEEFGGDFCGSHSFRLIASGEVPADTFVSSDPLKDSAFSKIDKLWTGSTELFLRANLGQALTDKKESGRVAVGEWIEHDDVDDTE